MAVSQLTRNLRDGELVLKDGSSTPISLTILLDQGNLTWSQRTHTVEVLNRGMIAGGHTRKGAEESVHISFSAKWTQLIGKSVVSADPLQLYEMLMFLSGTGVVSTSNPGEQDTLRLEFTVHDPANVASERIIFHKVYRESLTMAEGKDSNVITFSGRSFEVAPTIQRV